MLKIKRLLDRSGNRWKDNIEMDLGEARCGVGLCGLGWGRVAGFFFFEN
jgi:hypothetical protein